MIAKKLEQLKDTLPVYYTPHQNMLDASYIRDLPDDLKKDYIAQAEIYLDYDFPAIKASVFMEYVRTGSRTQFQKLYSERLQALNHSIAAELIEKRGRFIDLMIDMIWLLCEQTSWVVAAHNIVGGYKHVHLPLPEKDNQIIDLMAAETGASVAFACYFFKDEFDKVSPQIYTRAKKELFNRIINPYRQRTDYWWMGFMSVDNERLNNWNPWINSNVLIVLLLMEDNKPERYYTLNKIAQSLDLYFESHPDDGGCDEGPGYWGRAGASFFECLEILYEFTEGQLDFYGNEKIRKMCAYIYETHISGQYFVNFADARSKPAVDIPLVYRFGKAVGDKKAMSFASYLLKTSGENSVENHSWTGMFKKLGKAEVLENLKSYKDSYIPVKSSYFKDIHVACVRTGHNNDGLFMAAKGGNNFENHNHNDIGNFIVYGDDKPFIIDAGAQVYTAKTFGPERYDIWNNRSLWHNVPEINGFEQRHGRQYQASDVSFNELDKKYVFSMDIKDAYPKEAGISYWKRTFTVNKSSNDMVVTDRFKIDSPGNINFHLLTLPKPKINGNSITLQNGDKILSIHSDIDLHISYEKITIDDANLMSSWGGCLYRITMQMSKSINDGSMYLKISLK